MYKYTENAIENYGENTSHGLLLKHIPRGSRVLEFGCGKGVFARYITETLDCSVTGVDISEEAIEIAGAHIEKALVANLDRKGWQEEIPYRDYDVIVCADLLEHLASPERFLVQVRELLKDDGRLIFSVPNIAHADVLANLFLGNFNYTDIGLLDETHVHFFARNNVVQTFANAGWTLYDLKGTTVPFGFTEQALHTEDTALKDAVCSADYSTVYQFVGAAYKKAHAKEVGAVLNDSLPKNQLSVAKAYFDVGNGFSEEQTESFTINGTSVSLTIHPPKGTKQIRFDPTDDGLFVCSGITFRAGDKPLTPHTVLGVEQMGALSVFMGDPQFHFSVENAEEPICVLFDVARLPIGEDQFKELKQVLVEHSEWRSVKERFADLSDRFSLVSDQYAQCKDALAEATDKNAALESSLASALESYQKMDAESKARIQALAEELAVKKSTLETYESLNRSLTAQRDELTTSLAQEKETSAAYQAYYASAVAQRDAHAMRADNLQLMYDTMASSAAWKITKPLRATLDLFKRIFRKLFHSHS